MKTKNSIDRKLLTREEVVFRTAQWHTMGKTIVFTNGCFDILHPGHIASLIEASQYADYLIVGLNNDASVKSLKGKGRPVNNEIDRATVLAALSMVDAIVIFEEETPLELIKLIKPHVLVKGGDYKIEEIAGAKEVIASGGQVIINPILPGYSTTSTIEKLQQSS